MNYVIFGSTGLVGTSFSKINKEGLTNQEFSFKYSVPIESVILETKFHKLNKKLLSIAQELFTCHSLKQAFAINDKKVIPLN